MDVGANLDRIAELAAAAAARGAAFVAFPELAVTGLDGSASRAENVAVSDVDTTNLDTPYPTNPIRRKDLVTMRLPHHYVPLAVAAGNAR